MQKQKISRKHCILIVFHIDTKTPKPHKELYMRKINDIIRKVSFESFFQGASHHNARKYTKHPIWEYKTALKDVYYECF